MIGKTREEAPAVNVRIVPAVIAAILVVDIVLGSLVASSLQLRQENPVINQFESANCPIRRP